MTRSGAPKHNSNNYGLRHVYLDFIGVTNPLPIKDTVQKITNWLVNEHVPIEIIRYSSRLSSTHRVGGAMMSMGR